VAVGSESDRAFRRDDGTHDLANRLEHDGKLIVVLLFESIESGSKLFVSNNPASQPNERAHDFDIDAHCAIAAKHARQHRNALLGERVRPRPTTTVPRV
jgi:hypothetical protein